MGPRSSDRGNVIAALKRSELGQLQWGRDHLIAEIGRPSGCSALSTGKLQWGRDHLIAEIGTDLSAR